MPDLSPLRLLRLLSICCLLAVTTLAAATSDLRFKHLDSLHADELSVLSLLQDRQGFIWIGTHSGGLYRYNGYQAVRYSHDPRNPRSLPNDRVSALFEDTQGRIWAGTQAGVARYGGEEFALLAPVADAAEALALAQGICRELERLALPHAHSPYGVFTISIGVAALVPGEDKDAAMLVRAADQALYRAKQAGRNRAMLPAGAEVAALQQESADTSS